MKCYGHLKYTLSAIPHGFAMSNREYIEWLHYKGRMKAVILKSNTFYSGEKRPHPTLLMNCSDITCFIAKLFVSNLGSETLTKVGQIWP